MDDPYQICKNGIRYCRGRIRIILSIDVNDIIPIDLKPANKIGRNRIRTWATSREDFLSWDCYKIYAAVLIGNKTGLE